MYELPPTKVWDVVVLLVLDAHAMWRNINEACKDQQHPCMEVARDLDGRDRDSVALSVNL